MWWLLLITGCGLVDPPADDDDDASVDDDDSVAADDDDATPAPCETWEPPTVLGTVEATWLDEISGLAVSQDQPGVLWVIEDSGNEPEVVALNESGATLARVTLEGRDNRDWEDLALGPCEAGTCLFVADIGDNAESAAEVAILRLPEPEIDQSSTDVAMTLSADRLPFTYAEGAQDAEGLVVQPDGTPVVLTKRSGATTRLYALLGAEAGVPIVASDPVTLDTARPGGPVTLGVTAADLSPDGTRLLLREYFDLQEYRLTGGLLAIAPDQARPVPFEAEPQGEAVAYDAANRRYLHVSEDGGGQPPIYEVRCAD